MPAQPTADRTVPGARRRVTLATASDLRAALLRRRTELTLAAILLLGGVLRLAGLNWGQNLYLHPDERFMTMVADAIAWPGSVGEYFQSDTSPLNPYNGDFGSYVYGTFPLFLAKAVGDLTGHDVYGSLHLAGRSLSTLCDLLTVLCVFVVGRRLFGTATGLVGALLMSLTVLHIQAAHFFTVDAFAAAGCIGAFALALLATERGRWWAYLAAGAVVGLAVASKVSVLPIAAVLALPALEGWRQHGWRSVITGRVGERGRRLPPALGVGLAVVGAGLTFRVAQPYAFEPGFFSSSLDSRWVEDLRYWRDVQAGVVDAPPNHQWADRAPLLFSLRNLTLWGMGVPLGVTALVALVIGAVNLARSPRYPSFTMLFLVVWPAFHLLWFGTSFVKAMRYLLPAYPFLVVLAAGLLVSLWQRGSSADSAARRRVPPWVWKAPAVAVVVLTALYAAAFTRIYTEPATRVAASRWIYDNVPEASGIASEHWDDAIPVPLPGHDPARYAGVQLELYNADTPEKLDQMVSQLDSVNYIVVTSNRLYGSIPRLPERYPMTTAYYDLLFSSNLGFELVQEFTSYPQLAGIELVDDTAEESFTVYDHPKVLIFRKTSNYAIARQVFTARLESALAGGTAPILPAQAGDGLLLLDAATWGEQQVSGTWSRLFDREGVAHRLPVAVWYLAWQVMTFVALPLCWRVFRGLPDRGYALAKTLGPLLAIYVAWLLPSLGLAPFGPGVVRFGILVVAAVSLAVVWPHRRALLGDVRARWRFVLVAEILFAAAFLAFVWIRAQNPDLWHPARGGEKPMEFAYLNAVVRSVSFPPYDPWFAGGYINYYYFGYVLVAALARLTGIVPAVAFTLAVPTLFALTALNAWALATGLLATERWRERWRSVWTPITAALVAPLFLLVLGNLDMVMRVGRGEWGGPSVADQPLLANLGGTGAFLFGLWQAFSGRVTVSTDAYWPSTRIVEGTINEFPAFTFLFADLHPHLMALPLTLAAVLVALAFVVRPGATATTPSIDEAVTADPPSIFSFGSGRGHWRRRLEFELVALIGVAGLLAGALFATNGWDYPTYLLLMTGGFAYAELRHAGWAMSFALVRRVLLGSALILGLSQLLFWPYLRHYAQIPLDLVPAGGRTLPGEYLTIHGLFLFVLTTYLLAELVANRPGTTRLRWLWPDGLGWRSGQTSDARRTLQLSIGLDERQVIARPAPALLTAAGVVFGVGVLAGSLRWLLASLAVLAGIVAWRRRDEAARFTVAALVALAAVISLAVDVVAIGGGAGRMNTVFKFYLQVWMLLGIAASVGLVLTLAAFGERWFHRRPWGALWSIGAAVLVAGAMVYPALAVPARVDDRFADLPPTLDGSAYMDEAAVVESPAGRPPVNVPLGADAAAIDWLLDNVQGTPVVLEAVTPDYRWGGRVSVYTGLPTVLGWDWHERQQRPGYAFMVDERLADVQRMLGEPSSFTAIQPLLEKYDVQYIYLGDLEYAYYDAAALAKFHEAAMAGQLEPVYQSAGVTIYRYDGAAG